MQCSSIRKVINVISVTVVFAVAVVIVSGCAAMFPLDVNRPVVNSTGATLDAIFIRNSGNTDWGQRRNQVRRTRKIPQEGGYRIEYVTDASGNPVYDVVEIASGGSYQYSFQVPRAPKGETQVIEKTVDVMARDSRGLFYIKENIDLANIHRIVITQEDMLPILTAENNTGYPITIISPINKNLANGSSAIVFQGDRETTSNNVISYTCGTFTFQKDVTVGREHTTVSLTERPPIVTLENNTGATINMVFIRNSGNEWGRSLTSDGTSADVRVGSFTNKESKKIWLGGIEGLTPGIYDFRFDDIQQNSYVKNNMHITEDMTITFTEEDKP